MFLAKMTVTGRRAPGSAARKLVLVCTEIGVILRSRKVYPMKKNPESVSLTAALACLFAICALILSAGCSQPDPRTMPITAATPEDFAEWKNTAVQKITGPEMHEFESCVNEIRMGIMQRREATGAGPIAQKLCGYIDGKTMREVIVMGHNATIAWVTKEIAFQRANIAKTEEALRGPGSDSAKQGLRDYLATANDNVAKLEARLAKAKARLAELRTIPTTP